VLAAQVSERKAYCDVWSASSLSAEPPSSRANELKESAFQSICSCLEFQQTLEGRLSLQLFAGIKAHPRQPFHNKHSWNGDNGQHVYYNPLKRSRQLERNPHSRRDKGRSGHEFPTRREGRKAQPSAERYR
jgi:hypothetical protein